MVPTAVDPPTTPSTDQVAPPLVAVNCCVRVNVKAAARGDMENPVPVPDRLTVCGLPVALSETATPEAREPVVVGVKLTLIVQELAATRLVPQLLVCEKSPKLPPEIAIELIVNGALPTLLRVTGTALLVVPVETLPKLMVLGVRLTTGPDPAPT